MTAPRQLAQQQATGAEEAPGHGSNGASSAVPVPLALATSEQQAADSGAAPAGASSETAAGEVLAGKGPSASSALQQAGPRGGQLVVSSSSASLQSASGDGGPSATASSASLPVCPPGVGAGLAAAGAPGATGSGLLHSGDSSVVGGSTGIDEGNGIGNKTLYLGNLHPFVTEQTLQASGARCATALAAVCCRCCRPCCCRHHPLPCPQLPCPASAAGCRSCLPAWGA